MIQTKNLVVQLGEFSLQSVTFAVKQGQYAVLMGKTGSGKTTLLEAICGLRRVKSGEIWLNGQNVTYDGPAIRGIGLVPQDGALFSTMTIRGHLEFALKIRKWSPQAMDDRVAELAKMLRIEPLLDRYPTGLSGGERQRVSLGRALSFRPPILCLDEPLSALDDDTRSDMMKLLKRVQSETGVTALHVTHNRIEANELADTMLAIDHGELQ